MKRFILIWAMWLAFVCSVVSAGAADLRDDAGATFTLPASLKIIEESAFENTAVHTVVLSDAVAVIGDRAFAQNRGLRAVRVPESVTYIGERAFAGSPGVMIYGVDGSYAAAWARAHNVAFVGETVSAWRVTRRRLLRGELLLSLLFTAICPMPEIRLRDREEDGGRSMRPQDRTELYPIDYRFP